MNVVIITGPEQGRRFPLVGGKNVMGRADDCQIQLPSNQISRKHAALIWTDDGRVILEDQGSANGTFINGARIGQAVELRPGMQFQLGEFTLSVEPPAAANYGGYGAQQPYGGSQGGGPMQGAGGYGGDAYGYNPEAFAPQTQAAQGAAAGGGRGPSPSSGVGIAPQVISAGGGAAGGMAGGMALPSRVTSRESMSTAWSLYSKLRILPWRAQVILLAFAAFIFLVGGVLTPLLKGMESQIEQEVMARGILLAQDMGARNGDYIRQRLDTRLDVKTVQGQQGVRAAFLLNAQGLVLAPAELRGQQKFNTVTKEAFSTRSPVARPAEEVDGDAAQPGDYHIVSPIRVVSSDGDISEQVGFAYIVFSVGQLTAESAQREARLGFGAVGIGIVIAGMVALLFMLTNMPIRALHEDAELVLRGDLGAVESRARWKELEQIASSLNRSFERMRSSGGGFPGL